jgi:hypothetical protein
VAVLQSPEIAEEGSFVNKKFRRRFRIPYRLFKDALVPMCTSANIFLMKYKSFIPIELKILVALRILGRDAKADDIAELSNVGESTANYIFKTFVREFNKTFLSNYVEFLEGDDLIRTMETYRVLGTPGAIGSVDCTHVRLQRCPKTLRWLCTGKESYPSLSFHVVVDHFRSILYVGDACFGASSDKTISRNDSLINSFKNGRFTTTKNIAANTEMLWNYGDAYEFI